MSTSSKCRVILMHVQSHLKVFEWRDKFFLHIEESGRVKNIFQMMQNTETGVSFIVVVVVTQVPPVRWTI